MFKSFSEVSNIYCQTVLTTMILIYTCRLKRQSKKHQTNFGRLDLLLYLVLIDLNVDIKVVELSELNII